MAGCVVEVALPPPASVCPIGTENHINHQRNGPSMNNRTTLTVGIAVVVVLLVAILGHWGSDGHGLAERLEKELRLCRMAHAVQVPLMVQSCKRAMTPSLPASFLLEEPECARKLLVELKISNSSIVVPRPSRATARTQNGSVTADGNTTSRSSQ